MLLYLGLLTCDFMAFRLGICQTVFRILFMEYHKRMYAYLKLNDYVLFFVDFNKYFNNDMKHLIKNQDSYLILPKF